MHGLIHARRRNTPKVFQGRSSRIYDLVSRRVLRGMYRRLAAEMERKGLLVRERDPDNHRQYRLRLTDHGRATHVQMRTTFHEQYECWVAAMTHSERAALLTGLPALVRVIRQHVR